MTESTIPPRRTGILRTLLRATHGQDLIEYAILGCIVTIAGVICLQVIGNTLATAYDDAVNQVANSSGGPGDGVSGDGSGDGGGGGAGGGSGGTGAGGTGGGDTGGTDGGGTGGGGTGGGGTGGGGGGRGGGK